MTIHHILTCNHHPIRDTAMDLSIFGLFPNIISITSSSAFKRRESKRIAGEMHEISQSIVTTACGAAKKAWSSLSFANEHARLACSLGAADEMVVAMFMLLDEGSLSTIEKGSLNQISYLAEMRRSVRINILEEKNRMMLRSNFIYSENIFNDDAMLRHIQDGRTFIESELVYNSNLKKKSKSINRKINAYDPSLTGKKLLLA